MLTFSADYFFYVFGQLLSTVPFTIYFIIVSSILCIFTGSIAAFIRLMNVPTLNKLYDFYMSLVRSMPFVLLLFLTYFTLPLILEALGIKNTLSKTTYVYITMIFHYTPIIAEVIRPAYLAVDKGQHEAAIVFGLSTYHRITRIIIPQALPIMLPGLVNQFIEIVKDTSLMYMIGLMDLMGKANLLIHLNYGRGKLEAFIVVAIIYWAIIAALEALASHLEQSHYRRLTRRSL